MPLTNQLATMISPSWKTRAKAALIHLAGSALVAALAAALVYVLWFPWPYTALAGGAGLFLLIVGVDIALGPLITLAVFDRHKPIKELRRDLAVVVAMQLAALGYGLHTMYLARPVVLALEIDRFRVVTATNVVREELPLAPQSLQGLSMTGPRVVWTEKPTEAKELMESVEKAFAGFDLGVRPKYWRPWDDAARQSALGAGKPVTELKKRYASRAAELDAAVERTGRKEAQLKYLPIISRFSNWVALVDAGTGDLVGYAPFDAY